MKLQVTIWGIMMKRIAVVLALFLLAAAGCSSNTEPPADQKNNASGDKESVIAESPDKYVQLFADTSVSGDMLTGITVKLGENSKHFSWTNVTNDGYYPEIIRDDLDQDADQEVVIILTKGYGTGLRDSEVHVLRNDFTELDIQDAVSVVKSSLISSASSKDGKKDYTLTYKDNTINKQYNDEDAGMWFDDVAIGSIVTYRVENQHLLAEVSAQVSPGFFIANVEAEYSVKGSKLVVGNLALNEME
ncbi:hypothetical protein H8B09_14690 [Paenibacillus sp. PR3]|uniref:Lipoprotein n=1 Tax=Paenibacillus terricola TaxID=2763503 RepID=A0ABR8MZP7_9BACL|nr:hypothetical protein [Paenibacillus terricola]MBD3920009.1 hypothetical protein [Paenibacillus terricola]